MVILSLNKWIIFLPVTYPQLLSSSHINKLLQGKLESEKERKNKQNKIRHVI